MEFDLIINRAPRSDIYREASHAAWLGLGINLALGIGKLIAGLVGKSFAMVCDAINSLGDAMTSLMVLYAFSVAQRPADEEHPYGHTRAETIAATSVALVMILMACYLIMEAGEELFEHLPSPHPIGILVAAVNIMIKEALFRYKYYIGKKSGSMSLIANAWDHRSDALCSLAVLLGLTACWLGGPHWSIADPLAGIVVSLGIIWSGIQLFRAGAAEMMDPQAPADFVREIREIALQIPGVMEVEKLYVRKTGLEYFVDMHLEVDGKLSVDEGHRIGHQVKSRLLLEFPKILDVLIHLEPHPHVDGHED